MQEVCHIQWQACLELFKVVYKSAKHLAGFLMSVAANYGAFPGYVNYSLYKIIFIAFWL